MIFFIFLETQASRSSKTTTFETETTESSRTSGTETMPTGTFL